MSIKDALKSLAAKERLPTVLGLLIGILLAVWIVVDGRPSSDPGYDNSPAKSGGGDSYYPNDEPVGDLYPAPAATSHKQ